MVDTEQKILAQMEFYFSDSNYPKDKYLRALAAANEDGYVSIDTLSTFKRVQSISTDLEQIKAVLKTSKFLEVSADGTMVKRVTPLPQQDDSNERTIYSKGWPEGTSIEDISKFFSTYGKVLSVRLRKDLEKKPKNSAFVEFSDVAVATSVVGSETPVSYNTNTLLLKMKLDYVQQKKAEKKGQHKRKNTDEKEENNTENVSKKQKTEESPQETPISHPVGVLIRFKDIGEGVTREILKEIFGKYGEIAFVDFRQNEPQGVIRFKDPADAKKALDAVTEAKTEIGGKVPVLALVPPEEEAEYWVKVQEQKANSYGKGKRGGRGGRGRGGRGRGGKRKRF